MQVDQVREGGLDIVCVSAADIISSLGGFDSPASAHVIAPFYLPFLHSAPDLLLWQGSQRHLGLSLL